MKKTKEEFLETHKPFLKRLYMLYGANLDNYPWGEVISIHLYNFAAKFGYIAYGIFYKDYFDWDYPDPTIWDILKEVGYTENSKYTQKAIDWLGKD